MVILGLGIFAFTRPGNKTQITNTPTVTQVEDIRGCYFAGISKDVYTLSVEKQDKENFSGTLSFKNFEKDSSRGTFVGTYKNAILLGNYSFQSEGMNSVMQVVFKKSGENFIRGYGPVNKEGTSFADLSRISYDPNSLSLFKKGTCQDGVDKISYSNSSANLIVVDLPTPDAVTGKDFSVIGKARGVWFFEASFPIELLDKNGKLLVTAVAQAQPDPVTGEVNWMTENFVPFKADFKVPKSYIGPATLVLKKDNASGLPEHDASMSFPITVEY